MRVPSSDGPGDFIVVGAVSDISVLADSNGGDRLPLQHGDGVQPGDVVGVEDVSEEAAVDGGPEDVDCVAPAKDAVHLLACLSPVT